MSDIKKEIAKKFIQKETTELKQDSSGAYHLMRAPSHVRVFSRDDLIDRLMDFASPSIQYLAMIVSKKFPEVNARKILSAFSSIAGGGNYVCGAANELFRILFLEEEFLNRGFFKDLTLKQLAEYAYPSYDYKYSVEMDGHIVIYSPN